MSSARVADRCRPSGLVVGRGWWCKETPTSGRLPTSESTSEPGPPRGGGDEGDCDWVACLSDAWVSTGSVAGAALALAVVLDGLGFFAVEFEGEVALEPDLDAAAALVEPDVVLAAVVVLSVEGAPLAAEGSSMGGSSIHSAGSSDVMSNSSIWPDVLVFRIRRCVLDVVLRSSDCVRRENKTHTRWSAAR